MSLFKSLVSATVKQVNKVNSFEFVKNNAPNEIGVYIMKLNGKVMYVGRAIENREGQSTRGLRKRLQEHWRGAGNCKPELYQYRDQLTVTLKVCSSVEEAKGVEGQLIRQYNTVEKGWNLRYED